MSSKIGFNGGLNCSMAVKNLDKAITWYEEILGFKLIYRLKDIGWCELTTPVPGVQLGLSEVEKLEVGGGSTLTFGVSDIDQARKELEKKEVRFDGPTREVAGMVKLATFYDLDGNTLMLFQELAPAKG